MVSDVDSILIEPEIKWVSRGAIKLLYALEYFNIDPSEKIVFDAGSSTGGFTQVLIRKNAKRVIAVDVGKNQLDASLRSHPKVDSFEKVNLKNITLEDRYKFLNSSEVFDLIVGDLSFISLTLIIPKLTDILCTKGTELVLLVKPQFEVSHQVASKCKGVVKEKRYWIESLEKIYNSFVQNNTYVTGVVESPIKGGSGNREFFMRAISGNLESIGFEQIVSTLEL
jgi:23S rRNA (cytidine1920-2'-O)/16S rRNA (cytidine1409-2'-O)-methyltransferase